MNGIPKWKGQSIFDNIIKAGTLVATLILGIFGFYIKTSMDTVSKEVSSINTEITTITTDITSIDTEILSINQVVLEVENDIQVINEDITNISNSIDITNINEFKPSISITGESSIDLIVKEDIDYSSYLYEVQYKDCESAEQSEFIGESGPVCFSYLYSSFMIDSQKVFQLQQAIIEIRYEFLIYEDKDGNIPIVVEGNTIIRGNVDKYNPKVYIIEFDKYFELDINKIELVITVIYETDIEGEAFTDVISIDDLKIDPDYVVPIISPAIEFAER